MSCTHLSSMERTKIEFFVEQGSRVCLLLSIQIAAARGLSRSIQIPQRVGADPCVCPS